MIACLSAPTHAQQTEREKIQDFLRRVQSTQDQFGLLAQESSSDLVRVTPDLARSGSLDITSIDESGIASLRAPVELLDSFDSLREMFGPGGSEFVSLLRSNDDLVEGWGMNAGYARQIADAELLEFVLRQAANTLMCSYAFLSQTDFESPLENQSSVSSKLAENVLGDDAANMGIRGCVEIVDREGRQTQIDTREELDTFWNLQRQVRIYVLDLYSMADWVPSFYARNLSYVGDVDGQTVSLRDDAGNFVEYRVYAQGGLLFLFDQDDGNPVGVAKLTQ